MAFEKLSLASSLLDRIDDCGESSISERGISPSRSSLKSSASSRKSSATSIISPEELQGLIDDANHSSEEDDTSHADLMVISLRREHKDSSIGITLAGGADENKDITVHKIIPGSPVDTDGRIRKGDIILSINGRSTKTSTHKEALRMLKSPRIEVTLVISRSPNCKSLEGGDVVDVPESPPYNTSNTLILSSSPELPRPTFHNYIESEKLIRKASVDNFTDAPRGPSITVVLKKEGAGLGFSLEGGKDSTLGDRPLTIKKIFTGGAADKNGTLSVGDEIISVNNTNLTFMSRFDAWNFMKKLKCGPTNVVIRHKLDTPAEYPTGKQQQ